MVSEAKRGGLKCRLYRLPAVWPHANSLATQFFKYEIGIKCSPPEVAVRINKYIDNSSCLFTTHYIPNMYVLLL